MKGCTRCARARSRHLRSAVSRLVSSRLFISSFSASSLRCIYSSESDRNRYTYNIHALLAYLFIPFSCSCSNTTRVPSPNSTRPMPHASLPSPLHLPLFPVLVNLKSELCFIHPPVSYTYPCYRYHPHACAHVNLPLPQAPNPRMYFYVDCYDYERC